MATKGNIGNYIEKMKEACFYWESGQILEQVAQLGCAILTPGNTEHLARYFLGQTILVDAV